MNIGSSNFCSLLDKVFDDELVSTSIHEFRNAEKIITWNDVFQTDMDVIRIAKKMKKPTYVVQHGRKAWRDYVACEPMADYFLAWGENDKKMAIELGWKPENVIRTGCTYFDILPERNVTDKTVVFLPSHGSLTKDVIIDTNYKIWDRMLRSRNIRPVLKVVDNNFMEYQRQGTIINTLRNSVTHIPEVLHLLSKAYCVIQYNDITHDTINLLAKLMDVPILIINHEWQLIDLEAYIKETVDTFKSTSTTQEVINDAGYVDKDTPSETIKELLKAC